MGIAALVVCGSVNATSWRVCSKPEAGANFLSVAEAVASNSVFAGDTLYLEPGHFENGALSINKRLVIIGPGYFFIENGINVIDAQSSVFNGAVTLGADYINISGCTFMRDVMIANINCTMSNSVSYGQVDIQNDNVTIKNCLLHNIYAYGTKYNILIEGNILYGRLSGAAYYSGTPNYIGSTIRNNVIIGSATDYMVTHMEETSFYNNIVINTNSEYSTTTNSNQTVDTIFYKDKIFGNITNGTISNNILSCKQNNAYLNCVFNAKVEDVLIWNGANTLEEKYKHKTPGPAVGAGVNGTTCGAYGAVNGSRPYQPSGIPQYRPYIYDAQIDETPSSNNTINASFKIKVQQ